MLNTPRNNSKRLRLSATARIAINAMVLTLAFGIVIVGFSFFMYRNASIAYHADQVAAVADSIAAFIDPDRFGDSISADYADDYWYYIKDKIDAVLTRSPSLAFLYIIVPNSDVQFAYYASAVRPGDEEWVYFMMLEEDLELYTYITWQSLRQGITTTTGIEDAGEWGVLVAAFSPIISRDGRVLGLVGADIESSRVMEETWGFTLAVAAFVLSTSLLLGLFLRFTITRAINYSFKRIVDMGTDFADTSAVFHIRGTDKASNEITSRLYNQSAALYNTFRELLIDMEHLTSSHLAGNYKVLIDEEKYKGGYLRIVQQMNKTIESYVNNKTEIVNVLKSYGDGNFDVKVNEFEGDWAWVNETIDDLRASFVHVIKEVDMLAKNAADGNFGVDAGVGKQEGEWARIIVSLNDLLHATSEPLFELEDSLERMKIGDFDGAYITKSFKGSFENVKNSLNATVDASLGYLSEISDVLTSMSNGDFSIKVDRDYIGCYAPIKEALNIIQVSMERTISEIRVVADEVAAASELVASSALDLADGTVKQNVALEELSTSMASIQNKAAEAADNAAAASRSTMKSREHAGHGGVIVKDMVSNMTKIQDSSVNISNIIDTITNIAFQTNLLALNASVEAARAGEHGKGFAVVAEEVRNLAGRSQKSASDTAGFIEQDHKNVNAGMKAATEVEESFETIANNVAEISELVTRIAEVSEEQLQAITTVGHSVSEISDVVITASTLAKESSTASVQLQAQADMLRQKVAVFKL